MANKWLRNVVGTFVAVGLVVGSAQAGTAGVTTDDLTPAEVALARMIAYGLVAVEDLTFVPVTDPHDDRPGDPNPMLCTGAETYQVDGAIDADTFEMKSFADSIRLISPGDPSYFVNQLAFTLVVACFRTAPVLADAALSEVSVAWYLFGQEILEASRFAVDPELGMNSVFSHASVDGQEMNGFTFLNGGTFFPGEIPIPVMSFWRSGRFHLAAFVPGRPEAIRTKTADAGVASLDALEVQMVDVEPAPEIAQLTDSQVGQSAADVATEVLAEMTADPPPSALPSTTLAATTTLPPADAGEGEVEPAADPTVEDEAEPADLVTEQPVAVEALDEGAGGATTTVAATTTTEATADESSGGSSSWLKILLGATMFGVLVAFLAWLRRRRSPVSSDGEPGGRTGNPDGPGSPSTPSTPDGPVVEEGGPAAPPVVPGRPPPPLVQCDWELWLGGQRLKQAAPGHNVCCVYRMQIESKRAIDEQDAIIADALDGRIRTPGFVIEGSGLGFRAGAVARSERDDGTHRDEVPSGTATVPERIAARTPDGLPPDVAAHLVTGEQTEVTVMLVSKCHDHVHKYTASADSSLDVSAEAGCSNTEPGDDCGVWMRAAGDGTAGVSGDLDHTIGGETAVGDDGNLGAGRDRHDHVDDGKIVNSDADSAVAGRVEKAGLVWSATFHNEFTLDAAQIVPAAVRGATDEVEIGALGNARHTLSLNAETTARSCMGKPCGCGATECTCDPSFELVINAELQELVADSQPWTLRRGIGGSNLWTAS